MAPLAARRRNGAVLGIDVGYSKRSRTTGLCHLWWDAECVSWKCSRARSSEEDRVRELDMLWPSKVRQVDAVAIDGPLRPGFETVARYRAAECALSRGRFQKRGKPGQTSAGSGPRLHREATLLAHLSLAQLQIRRTELRVKLRDEAIVEAFPNLFLGVLCDEDIYPAKPIKRRRWTDTLFPRVRGKLTVLLGLLLPGRQIDGDLAVAGHEEIAALACALTALCVARERFEAVGSVDDGFIILPPLATWGRSKQGSRAWADIELEATVESARTLFPRVERWTPSRATSPVAT